MLYSPKVQRFLRIALYFLGACALFLLACAGAGHFLTAPHPSVVDALPYDLSTKEIQFGGADGAILKGWYDPAVTPKGTIILMHGVHASRIIMKDRAKFLHKAGFSVLLYDSRAHGESTGKKITFGYLESRDAQAAVALARSFGPDQRIGILGMTLGGAAALLADPPLPVDALVLESVYPSMDRAIANRIEMRLGRWAGSLTPLFTLQFPFWIGISADQLRPIDHVSKLPTPKLFIAGTEDRQTPIEESRQLFDRAAEPKEMWAVPGAGHVDFHKQSAEYEDRILRFFTKYLSKSP
jgi:fermentation-respiration switch protein FrsA (DUF1100 family)